VVGLLGADVESYFLEGGEVKMEVGKKYERNGEVVEVKFIDNTGTAWGINLRRGARSINRQYFDEWTEYTEPKPPRYIPYTWEDREQLRGRWYRLKENNSEHMVRDVRIDSCDADVMCINGMTVSYFIEECEWIDGTPCGKVVTE
jgi:hypothetical protein